MRPSFLFLLLIILPQAHAADPRAFGATMPEGESHSVAAFVGTDAQLPETPQKFSGRITEVCQAKGCWVMLEDEGQAARVMMQARVARVRAARPENTQRVGEPIEPRDVAGLVRRSRGERR